MSHQKTEDRARVYAALGDPVRLRIVDELSASDRTPGELGEWLELPSNLLAHHLGVLSEAGIVERTASAGDRRRRYLRLVPAVLEGMWQPPGRDAEPALFVCSHNSVRSQLAAALWERRTGAHATSAGTHPAAQIHPGAVAAGGRVGMDLAGARPRHLNELGELPALVVTVCDRAHEELPEAGKWLHWSIPDPAESGDDSVFDGVVVQLADRIERLLGGDAAVLTDRGAH